DLTDPSGPLVVGSERFREKLANLVQAIKGVLEEMRQRAPKVYVALPGAAGESNDVLSQKAEALLEELSQAGYARSTEGHPGFYRAQELQDEIRASLLSVHMVADSTDTLVRRQIDAALRAGVPMLVWLTGAARDAKPEWVVNTVPAANREYSVETFTTFCDRV